MKFKELKNKLKDRFLITASAGVLVFSLIVTGVTCTAYAAKNRDQAASTVEDKDDTDKLVDDILGDGKVTEKNIGKEETVYLISDASGKVNKTIVSDHLVNKEKAAQLDDRSNLTDITNVKGDETFEEKDGALTWKADGNDIYYQGTTSQEAPITQKVTYKLDGKEVTPEELAGKSGKVTIRFDYTNNTKYVAKIDGEECEVKVPFAAVSALALNDRFSNVEVTNGKLVDTGNGSMVVGYAIPGLTESLDLDNSAFDGIQIPEYVEVTADVKNFEMNVAMTVAVNAGNFLSSGDLSFDSIDDLVDALSDASSQLSDGSTDLADGMKTLQKGLKDYTAGASKINNGIATLQDKSGSLVGGASKLNDGAQALSEGLVSLNNGAKDLYGGLKSLESGASDLSEGIGKLSAGATTLSNGLSTLNGYSDSMATLMELGVKSILNDLNASASSVFGALAAVTSKPALATVTVDNMTQVYGAMKQNESTVVAAIVESSAMDEAHATGTVKKIEGCLEQAIGGQQLASGIKQNLSALSTGADTLATNLSTAEAGAKKVSGGATAAKKGAKKVYNGTTSAKEGAAKIAEGTQTLVDAMPNLTTGIKALADGSNKLVANNKALLDGAQKLTDGSAKLADGITTFNKEGVQKIVDAYDGDVSALLNRVEAVKDAAENYGAFTDAADSVNTSVKFIYKLAEIKAE